MISAREIMIATPISQISGLAKLLSASAIAVAGLSLVTPVTATSAIASTDSAPIGIALPMIAAIVPTNSASRCQASGVTPSGTGTTNQISRPIATATAIGIGLNPKIVLLVVLSLCSRERGGHSGRGRALFSGGAARQAALEGADLDEGAPMCASL